MWRKLRISSLYAGGEQMERWHCGYYNIVIFLGNFLQIPLLIKLCKAYCLIKFMKFFTSDKVVEFYEMEKSHNLDRRW